MARKNPRLKGGARNPHHWVVTFANGEFISSFRSSLAAWRFANKFIKKYEAKHGRGRFVQVKRARG